MRAPARPMYRKILVPLDGSALAETVLPHVVELAHRFGSEVTLMQVRTPFLRLVATVGSEAAAAAAEAERRTAEEYLEDARRRLAEQGVTVGTVLVEGVASETVVDQAKSGGFDLIAMSTHGRSGLRRLVLGSVADHVVRHAGTPVLLVRAPG